VRRSGALSLGVANLADAVSKNRVPYEFVEEACANGKPRQFRGVLQFRRGQLFRVGFSRKHDGERIVDVG
jgi:hypothetical protein